MKRAEMKNGTIYLDGEEIEGMNEFKIVSSVDDGGIAELTVKMYVIIDPASFEEQKK